MKQLPAGEDRHGGRYRHKDRRCPGSKAQASGGGVASELGQWINLGAGGSGSQGFRQCRSDGCERGCGFSSDGWERGCGLNKTWRGRWWCKAIVVPPRCDHCLAEISDAHPVEVFEQVLAPLLGFAAFHARGVVATCVAIVQDAVVQISPQLWRLRPPHAVLWKPGEHPLDPTTERHEARVVRSRPLDEQTHTVVRGQSHALFKKLPPPLSLHRASHPLIRQRQLSRRARRVSWRAIGVAPEPSNAHHLTPVVVTEPCQFAPQLADR